MTTSAQAVRENWPELPLAQWQDTYATLHMWTQIVGKVRLGLCPHINHWWEVPLYVNSVGLTTSAIPWSHGVFEVQFDFLRHVLSIQTSEALTRICRMIVGLRLHSKEWSIDQAAAFFESQAHLPAPAARQEATRGTYDPTYGGYFLGKLAAFKLRRDYQAKQGSAFDLREFHERVMTNGIAPWWAHRQLLLPGDARPVIDLQQLP